LDDCGNARMRFSASRNKRLPQLGQNQRFAKTKRLLFGQLARRNCSSRDAAPPFLK
jgi:hypothetical protein